MKKLLLLLSLFLAGVLSAQTVTINTPGTITGQTFTNTVLGTPAIVVTTNGLVVLDHCQINSYGDAIDSGVSGTNIIINRGAFTSTTPVTYTPGFCIRLIKPSYLQVNNVAITGFASPLSVNGLEITPGAPNATTVFFSGCNCTANGSIILVGLDSAPSQAEQINGNTFNNPTSTPIIMQNIGTDPACNVSVFGNTTTGPLPGDLVGRFYGYYQSISVKSAAADQNFVISQ